MEVGMIGLGRMGGNMARRLMRGGHRVLVYDPMTEVVDALAKDGATPTKSADDMVKKLAKPRTIWLMTPFGEATEKTVNELALLLERGDVIIDGGNSWYRDSMRRANALAEKGLFLLDGGTSGGIWGLEKGYCLMAGGDQEVFRRLEPLF